MSSRYTSEPPSPPDMPCPAITNIRLPCASHPSGYARHTMHHISIYRANASTHGLPFTTACHSCETGMCFQHIYIYTTLHIHLSVLLTAGPHSVTYLQTAQPRLRQTPHACTSACRVHIHPRYPATHPTVMFILTFDASCNIRYIPFLHLLTCLQQHMPCCHHYLLWLSESIQHCNYCAHLSGKVAIYLELHTFTSVLASR